MDYNEALAYINDKNKFGSRLGLDSIKELMNNLNNPQDNLKFIHLAGTNGKGSTSSYLSNILQVAGYKVGLFTSPYLERFNERFQINGQDIPDEDLGRITGLVKEAADKMFEKGLEHPTTFEIVTAICFLYFNDKNVDYVVLEVGLGGRFDSTNVIAKSLASVITTIDFDHINELGDTLEKIAYQKAGIIKENGLVISYQQKDQALRSIEGVVEEMGASLYISEEGNIDIKEETEFGSRFDYKYKDISFKDVKISMLGHYQIYNAALAITTILILKEKDLINVEREHIYRGLIQSKWKGRLELIGEDPLFLIDGAHNIQGINNLSKALNLFKYNKLILGLSILKDKDIDKMLESLIPLADKIIATQVNMPRKLLAEELAVKIKKYNKEVYWETEIKDAIKKAEEFADKDDLIVFAGSLYLIGDVRTLVKPS